MLVIGLPDHGAQALEFGTTYLRMISWNFVAIEMVFTCSSIFQALGSTVLPAIWLSRQPGFHIEQVWTLSVISVAVQAVFSLWRVRRELRVRLGATSTATAATAP